MGLAAPPLTLLQALRIQASTRLAIVGAGGKSTALFQLGREQRPISLLTTSTHLGVEQLARADYVHTIESTESFPDATALADGSHLFVGSRGSAVGKSGGLDKDALKKLDELADRLATPIFIEADGSRQLPLKAPGANEPAIPALANHVAVVAGLSGLGQPIAQLHRHEQIARLTGLASAEPLDVEALVRVLVSPQGGRKGLRQGVASSLVLNQADTSRQQAQAAEIANQLTGVFDRVIAAQLEKSKLWAAWEPVSVVLLAAGASRRLGRPKQLLDWRGKPLVRYMAEVALSAGLHEVIAVTGAAEPEVAATLHGLPLKQVFNPSWEDGQSTSVQAGLAAAADNVGAIIFVLVDQPLVNANLLRALANTHAQSMASIVAPLIDQQRGNPVLFDRRTFADFSALQGDEGARCLFARYRAVWLPWHDDRALLDIDSESDYQRLLGLQARD